MKDIKQVIVMRKDLNMRKGKMVAQEHEQLLSCTNLLISFSFYSIPIK
jgi:peptidyl-tRNA hydrolase